MIVGWGVGGCFGCIKRHERGQCERGLEREIEVLMEKETVGGQFKEVHKRGGQGGCRFSGIGTQKRAGDVVVRDRMRMVN